MEIFSKKVIEETILSKNTSKLSKTNTFAGLQRKDILTVQKYFSHGV